MGRLPVTTHRAPLLVLTAGFVFSLAANLLWTWPGGPVRVIGGLFASVALPAAVHLFPAVPAHTWPRRALRVALIGAIAAGAAWTTFVHASSLLVAHGEDPLLAAAYPVMTELLVVLGVLAHRGGGGGRQTVRGGRPAGKAAGERVKAGSGAQGDGLPGGATPTATSRSRTAPRPSTGIPHPAADEVAATRGRREIGLAWARDHWPCTGTAIAKAAGVSRAEGDRIRARVRDEHTAAS